MKTAKPRFPLRHAQLHLPPLDADQALSLVAILERAISAIWRAHGESMSDQLLARAHASDARDARDDRDDYVDDGDPDAADDIPF